MASRRAIDAPPSVFSRLRGAGDARPRRVFTAFLLGAALSIGGLAAFVASGAAAHGPFTVGNPVTFFTGDGRMGANQPTYSFVRLGSGATEEVDTRRARRRRERITLISGRSRPALTGRVSYAGHEPVCVRLCDGYFFPLPVAASDVTSQTAACNSLCPDAPTDVYYMNGERIEDSYSAKGQPYTALPVSLRYRSTADNTCACHRDGIAYAPLSDTTLRRGDAIMTPAGFMVFHGVEGTRHGPGDFSALSQASMPAAQRGALQALERVSVSSRRPTLRDWLISQNAPASVASMRSPEKHAVAENGKIHLLVWRGGALD